MTIYKRNIKAKIWGLRILFCGIAGACFYLFKNGLGDYGFVLTMLIVFGAVIPITGIKITATELTVERYYCYAFFRRSFLFLKGEELELVSFDIELGDAGYLNPDDWWDVFTVLVPVSSVSLPWFIIKHTSFDGERTQIKTRLNPQEQKLIEALFESSNIHH